MPRGKSAIFSDKAGKKDASCDNLTVKAVSVSVFRPLTRKRKPHFHHSISIFGPGIHRGARQVLHFAKKKRPPRTKFALRMPPASPPIGKLHRRTFRIVRHKRTRRGRDFRSLSAYEPSPAGIPAGKALTANVRRATRGNRRPYFGVVFSARFSIGRNKKRRGKTTPPACSLPPASCRASPLSRPPERKPRPDNGRCLEPAAR